MKTIHGKNICLGATIKFKDYPVFTIDSELLQILFMATFSKRMNVLHLLSIRVVIRGGELPVEQSGFIDVLHCQGIDLLHMWFLIMSGLLPFPWQLIIFILAMYHREMIWFPTYFTSMSPSRAIPSLMDLETLPAFVRVQRFLILSILFEGTTTLFSTLLLGFLIGCLLVCSFFSTTTHWPCLNGVDNSHSFHCTWVF
ncbi:hypothetical protein FOCC_FOCC016591, partial [Frankliniella occidentalis]